MAARQRRNYCDPRETKGCEFCDESEVKRFFEETADFPESKSQRCCARCRTTTDGDRCHRRVALGRTWCAQHAPGCSSIHSNYAAEEKKLDELFFQTATNIRRGYAETETGDRISFLRGRAGYPSLGRVWPYYLRPLGLSGTELQELERQATRAYTLRLRMKEECYLAECQDLESHETILVNYRTFLTALRRGLGPAKKAAPKREPKKPAPKKESVESKEEKKEELEEEEYYEEEEVEEEEEEEVEEEEKKEEKKKPRKSSEEIKRQREEESKKRQERKREAKAKIKESKQREAKAVEEAKEREAKAVEEERQMETEFTEARQLVTVLLKRFEPQPPVFLRALTLPLSERFSEEFAVFSETSTDITRELAQMNVLTRFFLRGVSDDLGFLLYRRIQSLAAPPFGRALPSSASLGGVHTRSHTARETKGTGAEGGPETTVVISHFDADLFVSLRFTLQLFHIDTLTDMAMRHSDIAEEFSNHYGKWSSASLEPMFARIASTDIWNQLQPLWTETKFNTVRTAVQKWSVAYSTSKAQERHPISEKTAASFAMIRIFRAVMYAKRLWTALRMTEVWWPMPTFVAGSIYSRAARPFLNIERRKMVQTTVTLPELLNSSLIVSFYDLYEMVQLNSLVVRKEKLKPELEWIRIDENQEEMLLFIICAIVISDKVVTTFSSIEVELERAFSLASTKQPWHTLENARAMASLLQLEPFTLQTISVDIALWIAQSKVSLTLEMKWAAANYLLTIYRVVSHAVRTKTASSPSTLKK